VKILKNTLLARSILRGERFDAAISTGSSLAVSVLPLASRRGVPSHFIETAARATGPSLTGHILAKDLKVSTYTQYPAWADQRWRYRGSIFDNFEPGGSRDVGDMRRAVVTVGTTESYGFDRLVRKLVPLLDGWDVLWQIGNTDVCGYPIEGRVAVPHTELVDAIADSDVVIAHSGTGAALTALELGKCPVLVPRRVEHHEHVDDHQLQVSEFLSQRKLAVSCQVEDLTIEHLRLAAGRQIRRAVSPPRFELDGLRPSFALLDGEDER
jgi:UDP-N-acetylglucosamine transferase subunit ALG13